MLPESSESTPVTLTAEAVILKTYNAGPKTEIVGFMNEFCLDFLLKSLVKSSSHLLMAIHSHPIQILFFDSFFFHLWERKSKKTSKYLNFGKGRSPQIPLGDGLVCSASESEAYYFCLWICIVFFFIDHNFHLSLAALPLFNRWTNWLTDWLTDSLTNCLSLTAWDWITKLCKRKENGLFFCHLTN